VRLTHGDGVELTFDNIVNDCSLHAIYGAVMCWIKSNQKICSFRKIESECFFSESECSSNK